MLEVVQDKRWSHHKRSRYRAARAGRVTSTNQMKRLRAQVTRLVTIEDVEKEGFVYHYGPTCYPGKYGP